MDDCYDSTSDSCYFYVVKVVVYFDPKFLIDFGVIPPLLLNRDYCLLLRQGLSYYLKLFRGTAVVGLPRMLT